MQTLQTVEMAAVSTDFMNIVKSYKKQALLQTTYNRLNNLYKHNYKTLNRISDLQKFCHPASVRVTMLEKTQDGGSPSIYSLI